MSDIQKSTVTEFEQQLNTPLNERIENEKIVKEIYVNDPSIGQSSQTEIYRKSQGQMSSNFGSTIKLNAHNSVVETSTAGPTNRGSLEVASNKRFTMGRSSSQAEGLPSVKHVRKQLSLEQIRIMKEHQKIRDFFSKEQEEKEGIIHGSKAIESQNNKLPLVNKNLRHQKQASGKVEKKAFSLMSRHHQQKNVGSFKSSLYSDSQGKNRYSQDAGPPEDMNQSHSKMHKVGGRYQTLDVKVPRQQNGGNDSSHGQGTLNNNTQLTFKPHNFATQHTSQTIHQTASLDSNGNGNYDFNTNMTNSLEQKSIDSLMHPSLLHANFKQFQMRSLQKQPRKGQNNHSTSMMQPIKLQGSNSIVSLGIGDYAQYEPELRTVGTNSLKNLGKLGNILRGPNGDFDYNQTKLYQAVKHQQNQQSRQIVNDLLVPIDQGANLMLQDTYKRTFVQKVGAGSLRLRADNVNNQQQHPTRSVTQKTLEPIQRDAPQPERTVAEQHDALQNFSNRDRNSISILLNDQYSSSKADHPPGQEDPLDSVNINYDDKKLTKQRRMDAQLATLKLKRRTKFKPIPIKRSSSVMSQGQNINNALNASVGRHGSLQLQTLDDKEQNKVDVTDQNQSYAPTETAIGLDTKEQSADIKFKMFRNKIKKQVEDQDYQSESQNSENAEELCAGEEEPLQDEAYFKRSLRLQKEGLISMLDIIKKLPKNREVEESDHLICHLKYRVPFFKEQPHDFVTALMDKMTFCEFAKGESLMDQGDISDCMFIIYSGLCGIYIFIKSQPNSSHRAKAELGPNAVLGESAVLDKSLQTRRAETVVAHSPVVALKLTKEDYQKILYQHNVMEKMRRLEFLANLSFFAAWDRVNLVDFNNFADEIKVKKGEILYDIGMDPETIYVVRKGKLIMETIIEVDNYFRYPVELQTWEIRKQTRQICYKLQNLWKGQIFGHEEILQNYNRRCRVKCMTDCTLITVNGSDLDKRWPPEQVELLKKNMRILDLDYIMNKISCFQKEKTKRNTAVLDASKLNCHDFSGARSQFMQSNNQRQIDKMLPWINKARQNNTQNLNLLHELKKVQILSQTEDKFQVQKDGPKSDMPSDEFLEKKHARFVTPSNKQKEDQLLQLSQKKRRQQMVQQQQHQSAPQGGDTTAKSSSITKLQNQLTLAQNNQNQSIQDIISDDLRQSVRRESQ